MDNQSLPLPNSPDSNPVPAAPQPPQPPVQPPLVPLQPVPNQVNSPKTSSLFPVIIIIAVLVGGSLMGLAAGLALKHRNSAHCSSESCFEQKFVSCSPATFSPSLAQFAAVKYQIHGKQSSGCNMTLQYTANPNKAWINQPMTCNFDNKKNLGEAVSAAFSNLKGYDCTGPLVKILQSLGPISTG